MTFLPSLRTLGGAHDADTANATLSEIEARLRALTSNAQRTIASSKQTALAAGLVGGAVIVACAYLLGRRRGRRRASVLEIRRV